MSVHLVADNVSKLLQLRAMLTSHHTVTSSMLTEGEAINGETEAAIIAADLRIVENITALKNIFRNSNNCSKKIFVVEQNARLLIFQAYALGATVVISHPFTQEQLLATLTRLDNVTT